MQLFTHQENCKKSAEERDYSFAGKNHENRKYVRAINHDTNQLFYINSLYAVQQHLGISPGLVKMICKSSNFKNDYHKYMFLYITEQQLPKDYYKSSNKCPKKVNDEERRKPRMESMRKWQNKDYVIRI